MNERREHDGWLDPQVTEWLLSGQEIPDAQSDGRTAELARLLAAAGELPAGRPEDERAALAYFRQQRDSPPARRARFPFRRVHPVKALSGGFAAVLALGGVAVAAQNGVLPDPFRWGGAAVPGTTAQPHGSPLPTPSAGGTPGASPSSSPSYQPPSPSGPATGATATGAAAVKGLCEAYVSAVRQNRTLDSTSLARLEQAAGGSDEVAAYCAQLTGTSVSHGKPSAVPSATRPTTHATRRN